MTVFGRILSRYIFWQAAGALILILLSLTTVVWIAVALRQLELMTSQGQDVLRFLVMTTLAIPSLLALIAPIALLIACLHVLNKMGGDSELIVMTAGGAPVWALIKPLGLLAILVAIGVSAVNHVVGPWSQRLLKDYTVLVRTDLIGQVIQPWRFTEPESKLTVHIRDRDAAGNLLGLLLHDAREPKQIASYLAERAQIIKQGDTAYLRMEKGHILRRNANETAPQIIAFAEYIVDLNQLEQRADQAQWTRPRERYTPELIWPDPADPLYKSSPGRLTSELHERLSSPLYPIAFVIVVVAFLGGAQTTRQNRLQAVIGAFSFATLSRILGIAAANAAAVRPNAAYLLYAVPVGTGLWALIATYRQAAPRPPARAQLIVGAIGDWIRAHIARVVAARTRRLQRRRARGSGSFLRRTLRRYVAKRFLFSILGAFVVCACLIFMIDMVELLRMSRRATNLSGTTLLWMGLLRLPAFSEILLAFAVLVGSIGALLSLNRKSELTVMRSAGMSAWQFLRPGLTVTLVLGVLAVTLFNPLAATARSEAEQLIAEVFGREAGLLAASGEGSWLRQDGADGQSVINARATSNQGLSLAGVIAFQFNPQGQFIERMDADRAVLQDGYWELHRTTISRPLREPEFFDVYALSTHLNRERAGDALGSEIAVSFWQLPDLIQASEKAGLSASKYRMQQALLISRPGLLIVMVVLAATVSLRSFRSGGIQTMVLMGMIGGIGFFLLAEISRQVGAAGLLSPALAVWVPIALALLVSLTVLLHQEDG
ncbi:MAG: LPS export ABC transporter permease LptG [Hyphomonadaceae bacterium]|jgi:lipopolysaccharide export system permease protein|nr:LPS export ABC transporter permease LptG [Hyphomonadaceae bacterium]